MGDMEAAAAATGTPALAADSVCQALDLAWERSLGGTVVVSGSVYLVGEARLLLIGGGKET